jgi:hypothetical protein
MKDKDIIYIPNSASDQIGKFLGLVGLLTSPVISGVTTCGASSKDSAILGCEVLRSSGPRC